MNDYKFFYDEVWRSQGDDYADYCVVGYDPV
jgi:hypothetical protein